MKFNALDTIEVDEELGYHDAIAKAEAAVEAKIEREFGDITGSRAFEAHEVEDGVWKVEVDFYMNHDQLYKVLCQNAERAKSKIHAGVSSGPVGVDDIEFDGDVTVITGETTVYTEFDAETSVVIKQARAFVEDEFGGVNTVDDPLPAEDGYHIVPYTVNLDSNESTHTVNAAESILADYEPSEDWNMFRFQGMK